MEALEDKCIVFCFCSGLFVLGGFVYAIASAACKFLYRKNNELCDI